MDADAAALPGAQRIALDRVFDLQHLGAEIGEVRGNRVAGDQPRQVDDPHAIERTAAAAGSNDFSGGLIGAVGSSAIGEPTLSSPGPERRPALLFPAHKQFLIQSADDGGYGHVDDIPPGRWRHRQPEHVCLEALAERLPTILLAVLIIGSVGVFAITAFTWLWIKHAVGVQHASASTARH